MTRSVGVAGPVVGGGAGDAVAGQPFGDGVQATTRHVLGEDYVDGVSRWQELEQAWDAAGSCTIWYDSSGWSERAGRDPEGPSREEDHRSESRR